MNDSTSLKRCSKCGVEFPRTSEYFYSAKRTKDKLRPDCKLCKRLSVAIYRDENRDAVRESDRKYKESNRESVLAYKRKAGKLYYIKNRDTIRLQHKKWKSNNPERQRLLNNARRDRENQLPNSFTLSDWKRCIDYFHGCCAVCGKQLRDLFDDTIPNMDHWIPISNPDCPGTVPENIVCLCGQRGGCNQSKHNKDPQVWLAERFGKRKAKQILKRINDYFETVLAA